MMASVRRVVCLAAVAGALVMPARNGRRSARALGAPNAAVRGPGEYTIMGADGKVAQLSLKEKERVFIDAIQSYYFDGRQVLNDTDFDQLKEDLVWEGSDYAVLSRNETKFLGAMASFASGEPIMSNAEFDELKASLKAQNSLIAVTKEPRCFIDSGVCSVTFQEDTFRKTLLYLPAFLVGTILWTGITYELIPSARGLNPLALLAVGSPIMFAFAQVITERVIFKDPLIAQGDCPECGANQRIFFGDILGVDGPSDKSVQPCSNCKVELTVTRENLRVSTVMKSDELAAAPAAATA
ncbi:hypothetical protein M885DRAFT_508288 [Pelagophyceae sp. CCMP2097]|nr:hypothetical protein M885DRAFT_508288 [Pelagophyceae sp. CCMP2097]|mmetsp:Transcript_7303/g.23794  ORF Transcript_7303/g.23794 Transcript_7303/m.23794 type:complete len:297 (-) Transcript_7303:168-1058(-)